MLRATDLAWVAGFLDGEGNYGAPPRNKGEGLFQLPRMIVQAAQKDRRVLDQLVIKVGMGRVTGPYPHRGLRRKVVGYYYRWNIEGFEKFQALVAMLWPFMCEVKRIQAKEALAVWHRACTPTACPRDPSHTLDVDVRGKPICRNCRTDAAFKRWETRKREVAASL